MRRRRPFERKGDPLRPQRVADDLLSALRANDDERATDLMVAFFGPPTTGFKAYTFATRLADVATVALRRIRDVVSPGSEVAATPMTPEPEAAWSCAFVNDRLFGHAERAFNSFGKLMEKAETDAGAEWFASCMSALAMGTVQAEAMADQVEAQR